MTTNNKKHIIADEKVSIISFCTCYLSLRKVLVEFNISSSHSNNSLPIRFFSHEQFLISKYSSILHALLHSQSHVPGFHI